MLCDVYFHNYLAFSLWTWDIGFGLSQFDFHHLARRAGVGGRQPVERKRRASSWASALPPASRYLLVRRCDQVTARIGHQIADDDRLNVNNFHLCPRETLLLLGLRRQGCGGDWCRLFAACAGGRAEVEHGRRDPSCPAGFV